MMQLAVSAVAATAALGQLLVMVWFIRGCRDAERRAREDVETAIRSFVAPAKEGEASPLAVLVDQCAVVLAGRLMQQLQQRAAGLASGAAREELAQAEASVTAGSPWLGILSAILPKKFKNQLLRHPQMVGQLGLFGSNGGGESSSGPSVRERLGRG